MLCSEALAVPVFPAAKLALVEPDFDPRGAQPIAELLGSMRILRRITEEHGRVLIAQEMPLHCSRGLLGSVRSGMRGFYACAGTCLADSLA